MIITSASKRLTLNRARKGDRRRFKKKLVFSNLALAAVCGLILAIENGCATGYHKTGVQGGYQDR
jgi:hypothetical protein